MNSWISDSFLPPSLFQASDDAVEEIKKEKEE